jgi:hypothetical protein
MTPSDLERERGSDYGDMEGCHEAIASAWDGLIARDVMAACDDGEDWHMNARLVALMMVALKLVRESYRHKADNIADARVYLDFADRLAGE